MLRYAGVWLAADGTGCLLRPLAVAGNPRPGPRTGARGHAGRAATHRLDREYLSYRRGARRLHAMYRCHRAGTAGPRQSLRWPLGIGIAVLFPHGDREAAGRDP